MLKNHKLFFILILFLACFFRLYKLDSLPPSLNWDEISHGVTAQSLLLTGKDQWGNKWPIFNFRAYGDYPTTLNLYLTLPFVKFFSLNALSIRLPSAIMGIMLVVSSYVIALLLFKDKKYALLAMLLTALSPWSLFPSRAVFQSTIAQGIFPFAVLFFLLGLKKPKFLLLSSVLFGLSMYAYHSTRIIAIPLVFLLILINFKQLKNKNTAVLALSIFLIFSIPSIINLSQPGSRARGQWVSILSPAAINEINESRRLFTGPPTLNRLLNNRATYFIPRFIGNYLNQLNPVPLFFQGTGQYQFNIPHTGLLFPVTLPFFYIGLFFVFIKSKQNSLYRSLLTWHLIGLIPAVITTGDFPLIRAMTILPLPFIYIALGLQLTFSRLKKSNLIYLIFILIFSFQSSLYLKNYVASYFQNYSSSWQYGYQQVIDFTKQLYPNYTQIFFTKKYGEPHEFVLFYWPWDLKLYQSDPNLNWDYHSNWYWVNSFDKFTFFNDWEVPIQFPPHTLLVTSPHNYPQYNAKLLKTVYFLNGDPAFDIVSYD